jgi:hypothetical protein
MSPKAKHELAREHLNDAQYAVSEGRRNDALNALLYAAEAAAVSLADANGIDTKQNHALKAQAMTTLHANGVLAADYGPLLIELNQARKDVWYEGDDPALSQTLEDTLTDVEA